MSAERRAHVRQVLELKVRMDGPKGRENSTARDISQAGCFVETSKTYSLGQQMECRLELPTGDQVRRIELTAEVRHHSKAYHTEDGRGPYRGVGLRFMRMDAEVQADLNHFLQVRSFS